MITLDSPLARTPIASFQVISVEINVPNRFARILAQAVDAGGAALPDGVRQTTITGADFDRFWTAAVAKGAHVAFAAAAGLRGTVA